MPASPGIYAVYDAAGVLQYVGLSRKARTRTHAPWNVAALHTRTRHHATTLPAASMQRVLAQLAAEAAAAEPAAVPVRRGRHRNDDAEIEDVENALPNGMAAAVYTEDYDAVAALLLRGVAAAALDRCAEAAPHTHGEC